MSVDAFKSLQSHLQTHHLIPEQSPGVAKAETQTLTRQYADIRANKASIDLALVEVAKCKEDLQAVYQELSTLKDYGVSADSQKFKDAERAATDIEQDIQGRMRAIEKAQQQMGAST